MLSTPHTYVCVCVCAFSDAAELELDIQSKAYALTESHITGATKANYVRCVLFVREKMHEIDFFSSVARSNKQPREEKKQQSQKNAAVLL